MRLSGTARASSLPEVPAPRSGADRRASGNDLCSVPSGSAGRARAISRLPGTPVASAALCASPRLSRGPANLLRRGCGPRRWASGPSPRTLGVQSAPTHTGLGVGRVGALAGVHRPLGTVSPLRTGPFTGGETPPQHQLPKAPRDCCAVPKILKKPPLAEAPNGNSVPDNHQTTLNSSGIAPCPTHRKGLWPSRC